MEKIISYSEFNKQLEKAVTDEFSVADICRYALLNAPSRVFKETGIPFDKDYLNKLRGEHGLNQSGYFEVIDAHKTTLYMTQTAFEAMLERNYADHNHKVFVQKMIDLSRRTFKQCTDYSQSRHIMRDAYPATPRPRLSC